MLAPICGAIVVLVLTLAVQPDAHAQAPLHTRGAIPAATGEQGVRWDELSPAQRHALRPLERNWSQTDGARKQKWLDIATRFPKLPPDEQVRIQNRMAGWANLTPEQRGQARLNFQDAKQASPLDRQARWEAYQSLSPEEKRKLAARAARAQTAGTGRGTESPRRADRAGLAADARDRAGRDGAAGPQLKSNIVPNPAYAAPARRIAPTVLQAQPGATTSVISRRAEPPPHQQTGLPKIAASPNFVDKSTLLPRRGPQGAATRSAAASAPEGTVRR